MRRFISLSILTIAAGLFAAGAAEAAQTTATFGVTANAVGACTVSAVPMDFGTIVGSSTLTSTGSITVNCTTGTPYSFGLTSGFNWNIRNGGTNLPYSFFKNADFSGLYPGSATVSAGTGTDQSYGVYGKMIVSGSPTLGAYSDTVTVIVTY